MFLAFVKVARLAPCSQSAYSQSSAVIVYALAELLGNIRDSSLYTSTNSDQTNSPQTSLPMSKELIVATSVLFPANHLFILGLSFH